MAEQYQPNVGHLCDEGAMRDAVHFAVAPVECTHDVDPGTHLGMTADGRVAAAGVGVDELIGIADPFYTCRIPAGKKFWLFLYPNTITGLRHSWSHPAFKPKIPGENW